MAAGLRNNGNLYYVGGGIIILLVVLCFHGAESNLEKDHQILNEEEYEGWLKHMAKTSDPVSDETLKSVESSVQHEVYSKSADGETQLTGFDAWLAKQQVRKSNAVAKKTKKDWKTIYVAQDGSGDHRTITEALNSVPHENSDRVIIFIKSGTYYERFVITDGQRYVALVGEGADKTQISGDATAGDQDGDEFLKTYRSCTVCVNSDHFVAKDILIQNTAPAPEPGAVGKQAVALRLSGDKAALFNVAVLGTQDTLYDHQGRHYFRNCFIQGSIDFIFGNGRSYYKDSHLHSIATSFGSLTAQKRNETNQDTGFSFVNNQIDGTGIIYLGRAWGNYSRVVYSWSYLNDMILPQGWQDWGVASRDSEVFYAQYQCYGPGSDTAQRVWWSKTLTYAQAKPFLSDSFVNAHSWLEDEHHF
ncbi:unnamed protein product [Calypogeia fissa]